MFIQTQYAVLIQLYSIYFYILFIWFYLICTYFVLLYLFPTLCLFLIYFKYFVCYIVGEAYN